jgi:hypothetical protein
MLATDPGPEVDEAWWDEMLVAWFEEPLDETAADDLSSDEESAPRAADNNPAKA